MKTTIRAAIAALVLIGGASSAAAWTGEITANVNFRDGPGTRFGVIDVLRPGTIVDVDFCGRRGWCRINWRGWTGFVSARYVNEVSHARRYPPRVRNRHTAPAPRQYKHRPYRGPHYRAHPPHDAPVFRGYPTWRHQQFHHFSW